MVTPTFVILIGITFLSTKSIYWLTSGQFRFKAFATTRYIFLIYAILSSFIGIIELFYSANGTFGTFQSIFNWAEETAGKAGLFLFIHYTYLSIKGEETNYSIRNFLFDASFGLLYSKDEYKWQE